MKINNLKFLFAFLSVTLLLSGCGKEENVKSKATFFPVITLNGSEFVVVNVGTTYTDAGAVVLENGAPIPFETVSDVDATEVGAYTVTYSAINVDGFPASKVRTVIVVDPAAAADNLTGSYQRSTNTPVSVWAKHPTKPYTYISNNPGGVNANPPFNVTFTLYNVAPGIVVVPLQSSGALAPFYATGDAIGGDPKVPFNVGATAGQTAYAWFMNGPNFGTALRTFKKL
jgi:hypothetical protein